MIFLIMLHYACLALEADLALFCLVIAAFRNNLAQFHDPVVDFVSASTLHLVVGCSPALVSSLWQAQQVSIAIVAAATAATSTSLYGTHTSPLSYLNIYNLTGLLKHHFQTLQITPSISKQQLCQRFSTYSDIKICIHCTYLIIKFNNT
jgi:hypothetical protein